MAKKSPAPSGFKPAIPTTPSPSRSATDASAPDGFELRTTTAPWIATGVKIRKTGDTYKLASTQGMQSMDTPDGGHRPLVRETTLEEYRKEPEFAKEDEVPKDLTLYAPYPYEKEDYSWGMTIDLNSCVGCN